MTKALQIMGLLMLVALTCAAILECVDRVRIWKLSPPHERLGGRIEE